MNEAIPSNQDRPDRAAISIETLSEYSSDTAIALGRLAPMLSGRFNDEPIAKEYLEAIIESDSHDILLARLTSNARIVGAATMSIILGGISGGRKAWLEDFVVDDALRGRGVASQLFDNGIVAWAQEHTVEYLEFTSSPDKTDAHRLYESRGAVRRDTDSFRLVLPVNT